jgi:hypothetical protein
MKMRVGVLDHYNVSTRKLEETVYFYENVLGFTNGPRRVCLVWTSRSFTAVHSVPRDRQPICTVGSGCPVGVAALA